VDIAYVTQNIDKYFSYNLNGFTLKITYHYPHFYLLFMPSYACGFGSHEKTIIVV